LLAIRANFPHQLGEGLVWKRCVFFTLPSETFAKIFFTREKSKSEESGINPSP